ncbi:hypothetical protein BV898_05383 [Hypsibius exemplaris]|uniref:Uncharacterized protein n=1 Tax=Hypsibius exemplaris TaxID=2072580 RepID=A0A1W0WZC5_HYPEX|nr:hypothetical protein BV898_05383 [Hypsibius exemplaris]
MRLSLTAVLLIALLTLLPSSQVSCSNYNVDVDVTGALLSCGIRSKSQLKKMSSEDKRNTLIVAINKFIHTPIPPCRATKIRTSRKSYASLGSAVKR